MVSIAVSVTCLIYTILLIIVFFSKKRVNYVENKVYSYLLIVSLVGIILDAFSGILYINNYDVTSFSYILLTKFIILFYITWDTLMILYVLLVSNRDKDKKAKRYLKHSGIVYAVLLILVMILPVEVVNDNGQAFPTGLCVNLVYIVTFVFLSIAIVAMIKNYKDLKSKKYLPLFAYFGIGMFMLFIQNTTGYLLMTAADVFITFLMYFTIENPDMQMINILLRNKELVEASVNDKFNFLFKVSQEMKKPIQNIINISRLYKDTNSKEERDRLIALIQQDANNAYFIMNDITSISSVDVKKIKMYNNKYMTKKFLTDIEVTAKNQLSYCKKDSEIEFNLRVFNKYPEYLFGDNIKLKQVLLSIISNSIKYTNSGFIDVEFDSITRYDICRLVFTIKDSGCGMSISKINELLSSNDDVSVEEFQKNDSLSLEMPVAIKILKILGGSISIKSEEGKGSIIVVVIDQRIEDTKEEKVLEDVKKYNLGVKVKKRILVADDSDNLDKIERMLLKYDVDVISTLVGRECIDKISAGDTFDLIILKDDMEPDNAYVILKELKKIKKFKTPVVIMISKDKEFIKDHFINDGFSDCIIYDNIDNELKRIAEKYI